MRRAFLAVLLIALACARDRAPVRLGMKADARSVQYTNAVAERLQRAGCRVERAPGDTASLDRALHADEIDAYVESHQIALRQVLHHAKLPGPAAETKVRSAYLLDDLMWAPMLGDGDLAVVYRKSIDERCRAASRALMTVTR